MNSSLLSLYVSVLVPVFSEWIKMEDLCFLDSAVCNRCLRTGFLETLKVCHCSDMMKESDKSFDWVMLRGLRVKKFCLGWPGLKLTPRVETILRSRHLQLLEGINLGDVVLLVERFIVDTNILNVSLESFDALLLKKIGHRLTRASFLRHCPRQVDFGTIAAWCPNLKELSAPPESFILPIVDACELDVINNCHLGSLVMRQKCLWTYYCDLVRTTVVDETAVCLGEGKYYHMTNLQCRVHMTGEDVEMLTPLMIHLTQLRLFGKNMNTITAAAVGRCYKLTTVDVMGDFNCWSELRLLLQQSSKLLRLTVLSDKELYVDKFLSVVPRSCPLLVSCALNYECVVKSAKTMSALLTQCTCLTDFRAGCWPYKNGAVGLEYLSLSECHIDESRWYGRGLKNMRITRKVRENVLMDILSKNPDLKSIDLEYPLSTQLVKAIVVSCPVLTSVVIRDVRREETEAATALASLGRCLHLQTLSLSRIKGLTTHSLSAVLKNKETLQSLSLYDCSVSSDMVEVVSKCCPALTYLDLSRNKGVQSDDIIALLQRCCLLERLILRSCADIGPEILSSIKSPPLRYLDAISTRITKKDMSCFYAIKGFEYNFG